MQVEAFQQVKLTVTNLAGARGRRSQDRREKLPMFLEGGFRLPLSCPTLRQHGDHWIGMCTPTPDIVIAGSLHGVFCAFSIAGRALVQRWDAPLGLRLLELYFSSEGALWTIESDGEDHVYVARYRGPWRWSTSTAPTQVDTAVARSCFRLHTKRLTMRLASDPPRLVTSQDDGRIDVWDASSDRPLPPRRLQSVHVPTVLGVSARGLFFNHVALCGPFLALAVPTDVWLVQLGPGLPVVVGQDGRSEGGAGPQADKQRCVGVVGSIQDDVHMLDLALPKGSTCIRIGATGAGGGGSSKGGRLSPAEGVVVAHLRFSARWAVVHVDLPPCQDEAGLEGWAGRGPVYRRGSSPQLLVVAGKSAHIYEIRAEGGSLACLAARSQLGFNSQVLHAARSGDREYPWLFVLTLSGLEVWSLPSRTGRWSTEACRVLVQHLEFHGQLPRLPPLALGVSCGRLLLLPNPPGYTPSSLSFLLFHTLPRPSPHDAVPELHARPAKAPADDHLAYDTEASSSSPGSLLVLELAPLAAVFRALRQEVIKEVMPSRRSVADREGEAGREEGEGEEEEEEESLRFLFAVEYLDSSVVPPPEAVAYESGVAVLKSMYALLRRASVVGEGGQQLRPALGRRSEAASSGVEGALQQLWVEETRCMYARLARECASLLGEVLLEPQAQGVTRDVAGACEWFRRSDTPVQTVCERLARLTEAGGSATAEGALLDYLDDALAVGVGEEEDGGDDGGHHRQLQQPQQVEEEEEQRPPLVRVGATREEVEQLWYQVVTAYSRRPGEEGGGEEEEEEGLDRLLSLVRRSRLPWARAEEARRCARDAIVVAGRGGDVTGPGSKEARLEALLVLQVYEVAAAMHELDDADEAAVQVDAASGVACLRLPGAEGSLQAFRALCAELEDAQVAAACRRAPHTVIKRLCKRHGQAVVAQGPLFSTLESERPAVLAQVLACAASRGPWQVETSEVLRLLGPCGRTLAAEVTGSGPDDAKPRKRGGKGKSAARLSRALVCLFLEAHFDSSSSSSSLPPVDGASGHQLRVRSLLLAELLTHYLDLFEEGPRAGEGPNGADDPAAGWLIGLADWCGRGDRAVLLKLERRLLSTSGAIDWELVMQRTGRSSDPASARWFWEQAVRVACLASLVGRMTEAWDLLMMLVKEDGGRGSPPPSSLFLDFGFRYCGVDGRRWSLLVSELLKACATEPSLQALYTALVADLAKRLPTRDFLLALPEEGGLSETLPALLFAVGGSHEGR